MSKIEDIVCSKIQIRAGVGKAKYGVTMERSDLSIVEWLTHLQEELMDALLYIEAARRCLTDEIEEVMINRMDIIGQNGNTGRHYEENL